MFLKYGEILSRDLSIKQLAVRKSFSSWRGSSGVSKSHNLLLDKLRTRIQCTNLKKFSGSADKLLF
jgi:hypothetical protein